MKKFIRYFLIISIGSVILFRFVPVFVTPLMVIRLAQQKMAGKELKLHKKWKSIDEINSSLPLAVVCSEDQHFYDHHGFDLAAIQSAIQYNKTHKRTLGASTISQQTAKNVFLTPNRSFIRKGLEVYFTCLIEIFWSKERILEVYLNVIEMGDGIYGAEAASQDYFKTTARKLNANQAALIAAVLPSPIRFKANAPSAYVTKRQQWILYQMRMNQTLYDK